MAAAIKPVDKKWAEVYPELSRVKVPTAPMTSPETFARERERLFHRVWMYAARTQDLGQPGAYLVREFPICNASVLLMRGNDGQIRGFYNVCRHRCNKLLKAGAGQTRAVTCGYHGWTYDLQGRLLGMPDREQFADVQRTELGLVPIATETWKGFVFVNLEPQPRQTLREFLGELYEAPVSQYPFFDQPCDSWTWQTELRANWKVTLDLICEGYHLSFVHQASVRRMYAGTENSYGHFPVIQLMGNHRFYSGPAAGNMQAGPVGSLVMKYAALMSRYRNDETIAGNLPGLNPAQLQRWGNDLYYIFPNLGISMFGPAFWHIHYYLPLAPDRVLWEHRIFFPKASSFGERFAQEFTCAMQHIVASEDVSVAESNQEGLAMGAMNEMLLQDQEILIRFNRKVIDDYMDA